MSVSSRAPPESFFRVPFTSEEDRWRDVVTGILQSQGKGDSLRDLKSLQWDLEDPVKCEEILDNFFQRYRAAYSTSKVLSLM